MSSTKPLINLLRGWPHPSLLPISLMQKASQKALSNPTVATPGMLYGPDPGYRPLRESVAKWLTEFYHPHKTISPDRITITGGASQSLGCLLQVFTDPLFTRNVWIVAPAYMLAFRIFDDAALTNKMKAIPEDDEGIDVEYLENRLKEDEEKHNQSNNSSQFKPDRPWGKYYRHIIYAVPTFSNPSGKTMSLRRREQVVQLARRFDALIITDDVYDFLQWSADPDGPHQGLKSTSIPRIVDVDQSLDGGAEREGADGFGNAVSNGSFTKILGPGVRTGWVEGTSKLAWGASQAGTSRSGGAPSHLTATMINELVESGELQTHVYQTLQPAYATRYRKFWKAIQTHLIPLGVKVRTEDKESVSGGYFIWITLPSGVVTGVELAQRCKDDEQLIIAQGALFEIPGNSSATCDYGVRLTFAWEDEDKLQQGIERLAKVLQTILEEEGRGSYGNHRMQRAPVEIQGGESRNFW